MASNDYTIQSTILPVFYSSYSRWNTVGSKIKVNYIYKEEKGINGKGD